MHLSHDLLFERIDRYLHDYLPGAVVSASHALDLSAWEVASDGDRPGEPVAFEDMLVAATFQPIVSGTPWGRPWGTTWFRVSGTVPADWTKDTHRIELSLDLGFNGAKPGFQCEGLVRTATGSAVKGLEPRNHHVPVASGPGEDVLFYVEGAANPDLSGGNDFASPTAFRPTPLGHPETAGLGPAYLLGRMELRAVDTTVEALLREITVLRGLAGELQGHDPRRARILLALDDALSLLDPDRPSLKAADARAVLTPVLSSPAVPSAHHVIATGHAHIDSAWLWPSRETVRKVTRTYSNVLNLMDTDPEALFTSSSAQHFAWVKRNDPELFERLRARVAEGRFVPVGNMWVESDVNMPSGESLARQLLYGTRFFEENFGARSDVGWLPDSFGYSAALPQLLRRAGMPWFFAQKMCWNDTDDMPHHSFHWQGLDGSSLFTHFPPNNTYSGDMRPVELARSVRNFADHGKASVSLMPFGYGDGGGGPTREMMTDARLQANLEGSARVSFGTAADFFRKAESEYVDAPVWTGEMYLEFHRGVFTSQARTKLGNRRNEALLVEAELWCTAATIRTGADYPYAEIDALWQEVLLLQFHDILPGSAIAWVHREAEAAHERITAQAEEIIFEALRAVFGEGENEIAVNSSSVATRGINGFGAGAANAAAEVAVTAEAGSFHLISPALEVTVSADGGITSLIDRRTRRDLVAPGGHLAQLQVSIDAPGRWDAWDLDRAALRDSKTLLPLTAALEGDAVHLRHAIGESTIDQWISLDTTGESVIVRTLVDWHERHRLVKLSHALDVHAREASYETQFGHVDRPLHTNTSWDAARYEVCGHRWVHVGEPGYGVVIANNRMYGHDAQSHANDGHITTTVRQSLLRAPQYPDPDADQGLHEFTSLIAPAATVVEARAWGTILGSPLRTIMAANTELPALVSVAYDEGVTVSAVKLAADGSGDVIIRVHEHRGARASATLSLGFTALEVGVADLVETPITDNEGVILEKGTDSIRVGLRPFQVATLRVRLATSGIES